MARINARNDDSERFLVALKFLSDKEGFDSKKLAELSGKSRRTIDYIFARQRGAGKETATVLSKVFGKNYAAMLTIGQLILDGVPGEKALELAKAGGKPFPAILSALDGPSFVSVPKAKVKLSAGGGYFTEEGIIGEYHFRSDWLHSICSPKDAILFDCQGDSMSPFISDGETVLVDRGDTEFKDDKVFAIGVGDIALVKRLRLNLDNQIEVISDNPDKNRYPTEVVSPSEIRILGRVKWRAGEV